MLVRTVEAELLDDLAPADPVAARSRRDLQRVHQVMGTRSILLRALRGLRPPTLAQAPLRVLELGAGDGTLLLGVARALAPAWPCVELTLLDRQPIVEPRTIARYGELGWAASSKVEDVMDWAHTPASRRTTQDASDRWDLIVANLFLHHFRDAQLQLLLETVAASTDRFIACEPRRDRIALASSHLIGALGVNSVTRTDAVLSVRAGFRGKEITALWPMPAVEWHIDESAAGPFSHCFCADRLWPH